MIDSILMALLGGALIGLATSAFLLASGRVCGISGLVGGILSSDTDDKPFRATFVLGLLLGGLLLAVILPQSIAAPSGRTPVALVAAGLLVGFGTRTGNGCTSGHGICGLTRRSRRSLVATLTFMATGFITATAIGLFSGGTV